PIAVSGLRVMAPAGRIDGTPESLRGRRIAGVQDSLAAPDLGLLLVPALAIDRRGIRLGYGGGWYDRLRADPAWRAVPALVVLPAACVVEALPSDPWDVPFDGWIDESGLHWITPT
ncbi:MAG: 5-formyltetrahydrofolate cyclo-ligase, partial [Cyanobacteriota bacterium]